MARMSKRWFTTVPPQEIVPVTDERYESSIKGVFVVGDASGSPLVKIAANQGADVIRRMVADGRFAENDGSHTGLDVVIIGGGPAGLSAALEAEKHSLRYVVLERDTIAATVRSFPPGKMVYAEPQSLADASDLHLAGDLTREEFLEWIDQLVQARRLHIKERAEVKRIERGTDGAFLVRTADGKAFPARYVVIAVGRQGQPRELTCPGADMQAKVTYRFHSPDDYAGKEVLVVGGGNSAVEAALALAPHNHVTLCYRRREFFRLKAENRRLLEKAERSGRLRVLRNSEVREIREREVVVVVDGEKRTLGNDHVIALLGTLPPVDFFIESGLELDGVWTRKRVIAAVAGLLVGAAIYFGAKHFVLRPEAAGPGRIFLPGLGWLQGASVLPVLEAISSLLVFPFLVLAALHLLNKVRESAGRSSLVKVPLHGWLLATTAIGWGFGQVAPHVFTVNPEQAGPGPYYLPGLAWLFVVVPKYFTNAYGFYYLLYFSAIAGFGIYWARRSGHWLVWRRNLTIIAVQWTLWWGIPTLLAAYIGRNPWTPLLARSLNAWPLNLTAFHVEPIATPGGPQWWAIVGVVGVVWAVILTFIVIPLFTLRYGKIYCSYVCSCGALAETVGNAWRHRGPKGDLPRRFARIGFVFLFLASLVTVADLLGWTAPLAWYNVWVGTFLAGAVAIGLYPFLGQRLWCRMWCPLAFWMNFWGRWSRFQIQAEPGKCIDCNICNQYCQMGIDIKSRALQGKPVTLADTPCVGCGECVVRCPMGILSIGKGSPSPLTDLGTDRLDRYHGNKKVVA